MGHYSILKIGKEELAWKSEIPAYLSFLFDEEEFYCKRPYKSKGHEYFNEIGYKTTCKNAIEKLNLLGFDWQMLALVYEQFYEKLKDEFDEFLFYDFQELFESETDLQIKKRVSNYYKKFPVLSREAELKDFSKLFISLLNACHGKRESKATSIDGKIYKFNLDKTIRGDNIDHGELSAYLYRKGTQFPPWISIIANMFEFELVMEFTEVIYVTQIKLLVEAHPHGTSVVLELSDIVDSREELTGFHNESARRLIEKIDLYNRFFKAIINRQSTLKNIYLKQNIAYLIDELVKAKKKDTYGKGKRLEEMMEHIFSSVDGLEIIDKRMSNGDEEIDLILKNNVNQSFWTSLNSPCIFVECKNWYAKVGSKEIRDFETKLLNHKKLVKVGIFVSFNGFTSEVINELKRSSRGDYHIVLITGADIKEFIHAKADVLYWLEKKVAQFH